MPSPSGPTGWSSLWLLEPGCLRLQEPRGKPGVPHRSQFQTQGLRRRAVRRRQERWLVPHSFIPSTRACQLYVVKDLHATGWSWPCSCCSPCWEWAQGSVWVSYLPNAYMPPNAPTCSHGIPHLAPRRSRSVKGRPIHLCAGPHPPPFTRASPCTLLSPSSWLLPPAR